jgi:Protein of unknown function (DUF3046)
VCGVWVCGVCGFHHSREDGRVNGGARWPDPGSSYAGTMAAVKETELWQRLQLHLGTGYFKVWASEYSLAALGQRTVVEALADGVPCKIIWRAVWAALELPARDR